MIKRAEKHIFLQEILNTRCLPFFYEGGTNLLSGQSVPAAAKKENTHTLNKNHLIWDVPSYFDLNIHAEQYRLKKVGVPFYNGYVIDIAHFADFNTYVSKKIKRARYADIKRLEKKLESCFSITYKLYHGAIDSEAYKNLFKKLKSLTAKRFQQKKERNYELQHFEAFEKEIYPLLLKKQASIFVIYDDHKPISIRVDIHYQKIVYGLLRSFDTDYSKFGLGEIDMLKHIQWAFENGYYAIDLLKGYPAYKKKWSTTEYDYLHHIVYPKGSFFTHSSSFVAIHFFKLRNLLFQLGKSIGLAKILEFIRKNRFMGEKNRPEITLVVLEKKIEEIKEVNIEDEAHSAFRKTYYDHLYKHSLKKDHFKTYIDQNNPHRFYVKNCTETEALEENFERQF